MVINWILSVVLKLFCTRDPITFFFTPENIYKYLNAYLILNQIKNVPPPQGKEKPEIPVMFQISCVYYTPMPHAQPWYGWTGTGDSLENGSKRSYLQMHNNSLICSLHSDNSVLLSWVICLCPMSEANWRSSILNLSSDPTARGMQFSEWFFIFVAYMT